MLRKVILLTDIFGKVEKDGKKRGFTLVELMVVILIVGVLVCFFTLAMAGNRIAKSKAMMEITTKSSISVKPATFLVFGLCAVMVGGKIILEKKKYNSKIIETRVEIVS